MIGPGQDGVDLTLHATAKVATGRVHPIRIVGSAHVRNADFQTSATDYRSAQNRSRRHALSARVADNRRGRRHRGPGSVQPADRTGRAGFRPQPVGHRQGDRRAAKRLRRRDRPRGRSARDATPKPNAAPKHPLPARHHRRAKPIPKGASSVDITFSADNQPHLPNSRPCWKAP